MARIITKSTWGKVTPRVESDAREINNWSLAFDQLSWNRPEQAQLKEGSGNAEDLQTYWDYLQEAYPTKENENAEQNQKIIDDRVYSFARQGGPGAKFKNTQEKMLKALTLPKGAKEELNYPPDVADKILKGEPLFTEKR